MTTDIKRAAIYVRISLDKTGDALGVTRQEKACRTLAKARGWAVTRVFVENDTSASAKRPQYKALVELVKAGGCEVIIAWAVDRLTRSPREIEDLITLSEATGVVIATVSGDIDLTTDTGRMVGRILGSVARGEVERKSARQKAANRQRAEQGKASTGGLRTLGYEPGLTRIRQSEARRIRAGFSSILAGASLKSVARSWNAAGFTTAHGGTWDGTDVRVLLRNPRMAGLSMYDGQVVGQGRWTPIVTEQVWRAVQAILDDDTRRTTPATARKYLGAGLFRCECGAAVLTGRTQTGTRTYRCSERRGHMSRGADPIDAYVGELVVRRLSAPDAGGLLVDESAPDVGALRDEAAALRARLTELADLMVDGSITAAQLTRGTERARARLAVVESEIGDAARVSVLGGLVGARDVGAAWQSADLDVRRAAIALLMVVTLRAPGRGARFFDPVTVEIAWQSGAHFAR